MQQTIEAVRKNRKPWLVHAKVPLLDHHTSGVRKETYRSNEDLQKHFANDPVEKLKNQLLQSGINAEELEKIEEGTKLSVQEAFEKTVASPEPDAATVSEHIFAETAIIEEKGERSPAANKKIVILDGKILAELKDSKINCYIMLATPATMPKLLPIARFLGPKGLMPNPKNGTLTEKPEETIRKLAVAKTSIKTEKKVPLVHLSLIHISEPTRQY